MRRRRHRVVAVGDQDPRAVAGLGERPQDLRLEQAIGQHRTPSSRMDGGLPEGARQPAVVVRGDGKLAGRGTAWIFGLLIFDLLAADADRPGVAPMRSPARIFMSVDLPAPFSPTRAWTSPGTQLELCSVERVDPRERLARSRASRRADRRRAGPRPVAALSSALRRSGVMGTDRGTTAWAGCQFETLIGRAGR